MISRENILREQLAEYENQKMENRRVERMRRDEVSARSTKIADLIARRETLFYTQVDGAFASKDSALARARSLEENLKQINQDIRAELSRINYPEDYLQPVYRCKLCRDTGYVGELILEQCSCLKTRVLNVLYRDENLRGLERENFEAFNPDVFPDEVAPKLGVSQRAYMIRMSGLCEKYADDFERGKGDGLLFYGESGLGKTFLMNCIAQRVLARGFSVLRLSTYRLVEIMRRYHYNGSDAQLVEEMLRCDLLALDDLGAEPMIENVTINYLYQVINERSCAARSTIISTNFTPGEISKSYTERVASRMMDKRTMRVLCFAGRDVRR